MIQIDVVVPPQVTILHAGLPPVVYDVGLAREFPYRSSFDNHDTPGYCSL
jgi:hypothetical protein